MSDSFDDDSSYDSFEICFGYKQRDMYRGHPMCILCDRVCSPIDLNDNDVCEICEGEMMAQEIATESSSEEEEEREVDSDDSDDDDNDDVPLSKLSKASSLCQKKSSKIIREEVRPPKNLENTLGIKPRPSPPTKMTAAKTATTHAKQVTPPNHPRRSAAAQQTSKNRLVAVNPYAKKKSLPVKASSKAKSRVAVKPSIITISKPLITPIVTGKARPTTKYPNKARNKPNDAMRQVQRKIKSNKYIVD